MPWHLGILWPAEGCLPIGPVAEILATSPQIYHSLDAIDGFSRYVDYGSEAYGYEASNGASIEPDDAICETTLLESANIEFVAPGGTEFTGSAANTTYSLFVRLVDAFSRRPGGDISQGKQPGRFQQSRAPVLDPGERRDGLLDVQRRLPVIVGDERGGDP